METELEVIMNHTTAREQLELNASRRSFVVLETIEALSQTFVRCFKTFAVCVVLNCVTYCSLQ